MDVYYSLCLYNIAKTIVQQRILTNKQKQAWKMVFWYYNPKNLIMFLSRRNRGRDNQAKASFPRQLPLHPPPQNYQYMALCVSVIKWKLLGKGDVGITGLCVRLYTIVNSLHKKATLCSSKCKDDLCCTRAALLEYWIDSNQRPNPKSLTGG